MTVDAADIAEITVIESATGWSEAAVDLAERLAHAARSTLATTHPSLGSAGLSITLTDDEAVRALNREWRDRDAPTNVLSFPATDTSAGEIPVAEPAGAPLELGDIVLAFETCRRESEGSGQRLLDHATHLTVHGVLHLLGYTHDDDEDAALMEGLETRILAGLGIADPYADNEATG